MTNLPIKRTRNIPTSSYTWWEEIDGETKELNLVSVYTGGAYDGVFVIILKISKEIHSVVFTTHYILKNFSCVEVKDAHKKLEELTKKLEIREPQSKIEKLIKTSQKENALPKVNFPKDWEEIFSTSWIKEPEAKKTPVAAMFAKKEREETSE
jgi:hypothetical protein